MPSPVPEAPPSISGGTVKRVSPASGAVVMSSALSQALASADFAPVGAGRLEGVGFWTQLEDTPFEDGDDDPANDRVETTEWMVLRLGSTDPLDAEVRVRLWWIGPEGKLDGGNGSHSQRDPGEPLLGVSWSQPTEEFPRCEIIAVFETRDPLGEVRFRRVRTLRVD